MHEEEMIATEIHHNVLGSATNGRDFSTCDTGPKLSFVIREPKVFRPVRLDVDDSSSDKSGPQLVDQHLYFGQFWHGFLLFPRSLRLHLLLESDDKSSLLYEGRSIRLTGWPQLQTGRHIRFWVVGPEVDVDDLLSPLAT